VIPYNKSVNPIKILIRCQELNEELVNAPGSLQTVHDLDEHPGVTQLDERLLAI
jgi:hypothetical protein